jgi:hypothetical protein
MQTRLDYSKATPGSVQAMYKLQKYVDASGRSTRCSSSSRRGFPKLNGCAF